MIRYKLYQDNRKNSTTRGQWYGRAAVMGTTNLETLAARIQRNCTAKKSDVLAVLTELVEVMQDELQEGRRVKLDGFGSFKIGLSTKG
ncbi:MAG: HU family DNA-binding protein, partial [Prevotella sp.]|nr:HU family DNA-binding protein [Prevotella sp.]